MKLKLLAMAAAISVSACNSGSQNAAERHTKAPSTQDLIDMYNRGEMPSQRAQQGSWDNVVDRAVNPQMRPASAIVPVRAVNGNRGNNSIQPMVICNTFGNTTICQ